MILEKRLGYPLFDVYSAFFMNFFLVSKLIKLFYKNFKRKLIYKNYIPVIYSVGHVHVDR